MKKILFTISIVISMMFISCENEQDVKSDLDRLKAERTELNKDNQGLRQVNKQIKVEFGIRKDKVEELTKLEQIHKSGKTPQYILKLRLKQSHFSIDLMKHAKDAMNAIEFELPVSKEFYNKVKNGTNIVDDFRTGSFILNGSFGDWKMKVIKKEIR